MLHAVQMQAYSKGGKGESDGCTMRYSNDTNAVLGTVIYAMLMIVFSSFTRAACLLVPKALLDEEEGLVDTNTIHSYPKIGQ